MAIPIIDNLPFLRWHLIFVFPISILLWLFNYHYFIKYKKIFIWMTIFSLIWGYFFDINAIRSGLWFFNPSDNIGIDIIGLPIEEWIFLFFVPQELTAILLLIKKYGIDNKSNKN